MGKVKQEVIDISLEEASETLEQYTTPKHEPFHILNLNSLKEEGDSKVVLRQVGRLVPVVLLWRHADLLRWQKKEEEKDFQKLKAMKNPKIKKKVEDMGLLPSTVLSRLKAIGLDTFDITLEKSLLDTLVPRIFMSNTYGGNPQQVTPRISEKFLGLHGYNDWMYLVPDFHPNAPQTPGAPGIYLEFFEGGEWTQGIMRVITRVQTNPSLWQHMGMYNVKLGESLTREEWAAQRSLVRTTWATRIANSDWGLPAAARIWTRRELGREPTLAEVQYTLDHVRVGQMATSQEVEAAYLAGEETMGVYTMKCVGYDTEFQRGLCEKFRDWAPPPPRQRQRRGRGRD